MNTPKPFQIIIMAGFAVLAVAGLVLFASFQGFSNGVKPLGTVVIWGTFPEKVMTGALATLKRGHQEFTGISYVQRPAATFDTDLADAIASGKGPDMILISQEQLLTERNKINIIPSASLSERTFRDTFIPGGELFLTSQGSYAIPFVVDPLVMYYNRTLLSSIGVAEAPTSWEAVTGLAPALSRLSTGGSVVQSAVAFGSFTNVTNARAILSLLFLQSGYSISENTQAGYISNLNRSTASSLGATPLESAVNFYTEFANPSKTTYSWNASLPESRQAFLAGTLAVYMGYASERAALAAANPNLDFDMAAIPQPGVSAGAKITYGLVYGFAVPKASQNANGAFRASMALIGADILPALAHELGVVPASRKLLTPTKNDLFEPIYYPQALVVRGWLSPAPAVTDRIFGTMVDNVVSGRESVNGAITKAHDSLQQALK